MMDVQPLGRKITRRLPALWIGALLALACCGTALAAASASTSHAATKSKLAGKWTGHYSGAVSGHFTLHWKRTGSRLQGSITLSNPKGKYGIGGSVNKGKIKFGAVSVGAKYKGKVRGTSMSGTWTSPQGGGSWSATKAS
jgi:ABC-type phosphate transport system substrate-binding protein